MFIIVKRKGRGTHPRLLKREEIGTRYGAPEGGLFLDSKANHSLDPRTLFWLKANTLFSWRVQGRTCEAFSAKVRVFVLPSLAIMLPKGLSEWQRRTFTFYT